MAVAKKVAPKKRVAKKRNPAPIEPTLTSDVKAAARDTLPPPHATRESFVCAQRQASRGGGQVAFHFDFAPIRRSGARLLVFGLCGCGAHDR